MTETVIRVTAFVLGAVWGSFLNVCISRWPAGQSVVAPRSRCPNCERPIAWYENVPVLSWIALRARCRGGGKPISIRYPRGELAGSSAWPAAAAPSGPPPRAWDAAVPVLGWLARRPRGRGCGQPSSIMYPRVELAVGFAWLASVAHFGPTLTALRVAVFVTLLLGIAMTDALHYTIPDGFT